MQLTRREALAAAGAIGASLVLPISINAALLEPLEKGEMKPSDDLPHIIIGVFDRNDDHAFCSAHQLIYLECESCTQQLIGFMGSLERGFNEDKTRHFMRQALDPKPAPTKAIILFGMGVNEHCDPFAEDKLYDKALGILFEEAQEQKFQVCGFMPSIFEHQTAEEIQRLCQFGVVL